MSNTEFEDREERFHALATTGPEDGGRREAYIPDQVFGASGDRIVGAQQVAVYRQIPKVMAELRALAAAVGDAWYYRYPVKNRKENRTDWIEGPSIKLANDLARIYGNCDIDIRVVDAADSWVFYARFTDYETGFSLTRPFQQRKDASKMGGADDARRLDIAFQIGVSKAERNVTVNALQTYSDFAFEEAKGALVDKVGRDLQKYVEKTRSRLEAIGPDILKRVEAQRGRPIDKWLAPDVARTIAEIQAVKDGMAWPDDAWPPLATIVPSAPSAPAAPRTRKPKEKEPAQEQAQATESASEGEADAPQGEAQASASAATSAPAEGDVATVVQETGDEALRPGDLDKLKVFAAAVASQNTEQGIKRQVGRFWADNELADDDPRPIARLAQEIAEAHIRRSKEEISISDADALVKKVLS